MAAEVLGRAVDDAVEAELEGALVDGRGEGVIDDGRDAATLPQLGQRAQIRDLHERVRRRLGVDNARVGPDGLFELVGLRLVDDGDLDAEVCGQVFEERHRARVVVRLRDDVVAGS